MAGAVASSDGACNMVAQLRPETTMRNPTLLLASVCLLVANAALADAGEDFAALLDEVWEWQLAHNPMMASRQGDRRYNRQWRDSSLSGYENRHLARREFLRRLYAIDKSALSATDQLNYELFRRDLQRRVDEHQFNGHLMPFNQRGGVQSLDSQTSYLRFQTVDDYDDWLARMQKIDAVVEQTIERADEGRKQGTVLPRVLMERIPDQIAVQLVEEGTDSPFYRVFESIPDTIAASEQERLRKSAVDVIEDVVIPAYRELANYFEEVYLPDTRESVGLSSLPNGGAWYEFLARRFTTTRMTPDEIHRLGLDEVKRIRDKMQLIIDELEFDGDFQAFLTFLRTDPQFYFEDPDDLYEAYLATSKRIDPELVKLFGTLPRMPYGVKPIPDAIAPDTTTAYYSRPAADGSRAGIYWVNLYKPEVRPKYEIEVLSVHEAMPGHHLQLAIQQEIGDMPNFRRYSGFTAFVEGWGLYSESLGYDLGLYVDPYSRFGALTYDMWRAVRLVVDTGIHYKGWTRQQAIDFFKDNAAKTEHDIVNEIDRYIVMPGQALAYKIGQLKIKALRTQAESALGERFDVRAFHDELLGAGALPLDILQQRMDAWLTAQLQATPE
jgi:prolyl oligopeptidase